MPSTSPAKHTASPSSAARKLSVAEGPEYRLPTKEVLKKAASHTLFDPDGKKVPFRSLYEGNDKPTKRALILFIRHFFCGNCQEYMRFLIKEIPPSSLPGDVDIKIIGCGSHTLIKSYIDQLDCSPPFPYQIFAEPSKKLYELLGMQYSLSLGTKSPEYIHRSLVRVNLESTVQGLKRLWAGDALSGGDMRLNGGEFLFEAADDGEASVTWCHRMTNSRDHAEIETLKNVLQLTGNHVLAERPGVGRRRSTADRLRRSFSGRRQSWLGRNGSMSRKGSKDNSRDTSRKRSPDRSMNVVREEVRSRDGEEKPAFAAMNGGIEQKKLLT